MVKPPVKGDKQGSIVHFVLKEPWEGFVNRDEFFPGRVSRTLSKLFEDIAFSPYRYDLILAKVRDILTTPKKKFIYGLKY